MASGRTTPPAATPFGWLAGAGEMGRLVRDLDWSATPLGPFEAWDPGLKTIVSMCLASSVPMAIAWGPTGAMIYNDAYRPFCSHHPHALARSFIECWATAWERVGEAFGRSLAGDTGVVDNLSVLRDGEHQTEEAFYSFTFSPIWDGEGSSVRGVLTTCIDTSATVLGGRRLRALRDEAERAREAAEAASRAKDEFLAMLGHELRNPLAPMVTALQLLRLRGIQSREQEILERQVGHLTRLVDDLLDVSRITRGKIELRRKPIELWSAVSRAMEIASPLLEQRQHRVELHVARRGLGVHADVDRMAQVISNLLTNAAKYSDARSTIRVRAARKPAPAGGPDVVEVSVQDHGIGIAPPMLESVFEAFVQQPQAVDRSRGGLGLGLAIVRSLVEQHGGTVRAESAGLKEGSSFFVTLPAVDIVEKDAGHKTPSSQRRAAIKRGRRVLVVDDNEDAADMLKRALEDLGYVVAVAHDGPSALEVVSTFEVEIALLDIGLPVMDGYELAQRLLEWCGADRKMRMIAVTGYGQEADKERSDGAGFEKHLVKPIDLQELLLVLEEPGMNSNGVR